MTPTLLVDNSAWVRLGDPRVPDDRVNALADAFEAGEIAVCLPFLLEAGYSARSGDDYARLFAELLALPQLAITEAVEQRALAAQRQLARIGHHRLPPVDLLMAAVADCHRVGILHYDHDYDLLAEKTDLDFESVWLSPRGTL